MRVHAFELVEVPVIVAGAAVPVVHVGASGPGGGEVTARDIDVVIRRALDEWPGSASVILRLMQDVHILRYMLSL